MTATGSQEPALTVTVSGWPQRWNPQTVTELESQFPGWHAWHGVNGTWYVRLLMTSPPVVLRGESLAELRDQIISWIWRHS